MYLYILMWYILTDIELVSIETGQVHDELAILRIPTEKGKKYVFIKTVVTVFKIDIYLILFAVITTA